MINLRDKILKSQIAYYNGLIAKHQQNVEIYLNQPVGIGEHSDVMAAIDGEINSIAQAHEKIEIINHYFLNRSMSFKPLTQDKESLQALAFAMRQDKGSDITQDELKEAMMDLSAVSPRVRSCCDIDYTKLTARFSNWYEIATE